MPRLKRRPTTAGGLFDLVGFRWSTLFLVAWNVVVATEAEEDTEGSLPGDNQSGGGGGGGTPAAVISEHLELEKTVLITVYTK